MKLSVVIACYNSAGTLPDVFLGLSRQQWAGGWEIIFVNNGSTDASEAVAREWAERLPNVRIVQAHHAGEPHLGVGHTYSVGMRAAQGDAVLLHDADDMVADGWLQAMGEGLAQHELVAARIDLDRLNPPWVIPPYRFQSTELLMSGEEPRIPFAYGCTLGIRRSVMEKVGLPDARYNMAVDMDYGFRLHAAGYRIELLEHAVLHYRLRVALMARFRQGRAYGDGQMFVQRRYVRERVPTAEVLTQVIPQAAFKASMMILKFPVVMFFRRRRAFWFWNAGWLLGRTQGVFRYLRGA